MVDKEPTFCFDSVSSLIDAVSHPNFTSVLIFGSIVCFSPNHVFERKYNAGTRIPGSVLPPQDGPNIAHPSVSFKTKLHTKYLLPIRFPRRCGVYIESKPACADFIREIWPVYSVYSSRGIRRRRGLTQALAF